MGKRKVRDEECESQLAKNVVRVEAEGETITPAIVGVSTTQEVVDANVPLIPSTRSIPQELGLP